jgi:hypothetical protein
MVNEMAEIIGIITLLQKLFFDYLKLPKYFKVMWTKHKGTPKEYYGGCIEDYWKDLLGTYYAFEDAKKELHRQDRVVFRDVILTDWTPMAPGLFYTKRLLSIYYPKEFVAHTDISMAIPVVVDEDAYTRLKDVIDNYGAVHVEELITTMSSIPEDFLDGLHLAEGIPRIVSVAEGKASVKKTGTPDPLLGTAWTIYESPQTKEFLWYRFWVGVDYFENSLQDATEELNKIIKSEEGKPLFDFDEEIVRFPQAHVKPVKPKDIMKLAESEKAKQVEILSQLL